MMGEGCGGREGGKRAGGAIALTVAFEFFGAGKGTSENGDFPTSVTVRGPQRPRRPHCA